MEIPEKVWIEKKDKAGSKKYWYKKGAIQ
jgi:hypothetical protein